MSCLTSKYVDVPAVPKGRTHKLTWTMKEKQGGIRSYADINETVLIEYWSGSTKHLVQSYRYPMSFWTGRHANFRPNQMTGLKRFNILIFGLFGAGKSSFINTLHTLFGIGRDGNVGPDAIVTNAAVVGSGEEHESTSLRATYPCGKDSGWRIWDTWGLSEETYNGNQLTTMLNGLLADGFDMDTHKNVVDYQEELARGKGSRRARTMHTCVFMFPYTLFSNEADVDERVTVCKGYLREFRKHGMNPIILITQADIVEAQLRVDPTRTHAKTEQLRKICSKHLGVQMGDIHLLINYTVERERSFNIDRNTYRILDAILQRATEFTSHMASDHDRKLEGSGLNYGSDEDELIPCVEGQPVRGSSAGSSTPSCGTARRHSQTRSRISQSDGQVSPLDRIIQTATGWMSPRLQSENDELRAELEKMQEQMRVLMAATQQADNSGARGSSGSSRRANRNNQAEASGTSTPYSNPFAE